MEGTSGKSLAVLIDAYCRRVAPATLEQHGANSISSPLGIWLLLAACVSAAVGEDQKKLEDALGCSSAHARLCRDDRLRSANCSLFDLPLGSGHSWEIAEREERAVAAGERSERIEGTVLAAWQADSTLNLLASESFAAGPALSALLGLIGPDPRGDEFEAVHSAAASYTPTGFEAAAITTFALMGSVGRSPGERGLTRTATLHFDHPFAAVALAGTPADFTRRRAGHTEQFCLPLFSAWVSTPQSFSSM
jgi:hypothetical protein